MNNLNNNKIIERFSEFEPLNKRQRTNGQFQKNIISKMWIQEDIIGKICSFLKPTEANLFEAICGFRNENLTHVWNIFYNKYGHNIRWSECENSNNYKKDKDNFLVSFAISYFFNKKKLRGTLTPVESLEFSKQLQTKFNSFIKRFPIAGSFLEEEINYYANSNFIMNESLKNRKLGIEMRNQSLIAMLKEQTNEKNELTTGENLLNLLNLIRISNKSSDIENEINGNEAKIKNCLDALIKKNVNIAVYFSILFSNKTSGTKIPKIFIQTSIDAAKNKEFKALQIILEKLAFKNLTKTFPEGDVNRQLGPIAASLGYEDLRKKKYKSANNHYDQAILNYGKAIPISVLVNAIISKDCLREAEEDHKEAIKYCKEINHLYHSALSLSYYKQWEECNVQEVVNYKFAEYPFNLIGVITNYLQYSVFFPEETQFLKKAEFIFEMFFRNCDTIYEDDFECKIFPEEILKNPLQRKLKFCQDFKESAQLLFKKAQKFEGQLKEDYLKIIDLINQMVEKFENKLIKQT